MKQISTFLTAVIASILAFALLGFRLLDISAEATAKAAPAAVQATATASPNTHTQTGCDATRSIQVSGTAVINVVPDRASIQLGVQSNGFTTKEVEEMNTAAIQQIIKAVRASGVDGKDIATDWYIIEPVYDNYDSLRIKGYRINNIVAITLRDVSKTSQVIGAALVAGANQVINVDFYTSELRKYRDQARDMAMKAAQEKAQALAVAAGAETGCVLAINENSSSYYNGWWYGRGQNINQWTQNTVQNISPSSGAGSNSGEEPISLGTISVKAEINVSFGMR